MVSFFHSNILIYYKSNLNLMIPPLFSFFVSILQRYKKNGNDIDVAPIPAQLELKT